MTPPPRNARQVAASLTCLALALALPSSGACSNDQAKCSAPSSGSFTVPLSFSQTVSVDLYCAGAMGDAAACGSQPHVLDGATLSVTVNGSTATVTASPGGGSWSCRATSPQSPPTDEADGGTAPATGCYLLVTCDQEPTADAGSIDVQIQMSAQATGDVMVLVHELGGDCCVDEYTGTWQQ